MFISVFICFVANFCSRLRQINRLRIPHADQPNCDGDSDLLLKVRQPVSQQSESSSPDSLLPALLPPRRKRRFCFTASERILTPRGSAGRLFEARLGHHLLRLLINCRPSFRRLTSAKNSDLFVSSCELAKSHKVSFANKNKRTPQKVY